MTHQNSIARLCAQLSSRFIIAIATLFFASAVGVAQTSPTDGMTPSGMAPGAGAGSYGRGGFDNVNLYNGNLNFSLPLLGVGGRGGAQTQIMLKIDSARWQVEKENIDGWDYYYMNPNGWEGIVPGFGPGVLQARNAVVPTIMNPNSKQTLTRLTFTAADGTEYELVDTYRGGQQYGGLCNSSTRPRGTVFVSHEGTAFTTFVSNSTLYDQCYETAPYSDGISGYLYFTDGSRYEISNGLVTKIRDRNGNLVSFAYDAYKRLTAITDALNRQVTVSYADMVSVFNDAITFKGFGGATRTIKIWHTSLSNALRSGYSIQTYGQLFAYINPYDTNVYNPSSVVSAVELPDGRQYQLRYNPYGELARVVLPTGGAIEYDYIEMAGGAMLTQRRVSERRVYADGVTLESKQVFTATYNTTTTTVVEQRDPSNVLLGKTQHYFYGDPVTSIATSSSYAGSLIYSNWQEGREFKTESLAADGLTVLRRSESTWEQGATVTSWLASNNAANNPRVNQMLSTLVDTNQVSKQTFTFDQYNNTTDSYEYDFGSGAAGSLVRRTHTDFMTTNPVNGVNYTSSANNLYFYRLPSQTSVFDAGGIERARASFEYDNHATDTNHATLLNRANVSGFDSAFTTSYATRGNVTATTRYLLNSSGSVIGSISTYGQFDIAGNTVKAIDGRGYATNFYFDDSFGAPNGEARTNSAPVELSSVGQSSYAMLTRVMNAANQTAYAQYDYYLGRAVDGEDMNGVVASGYFEDVLDRPTKVIRDYNNLAAKSQILFSYDDTNHIVTTRSDFAAFNDQMLRKDSLYDGLGRTTETRAYENATQYITVKSVPFVVLQDPDSGAWVPASMASNPYRGYLGESAVWTTTFNDALGRTTKVRTPDNAIARSSYSGNSVTVTDQAGKGRKSVTDALGRMTSVYEDPSGWNYQTSYSYDLLDDLITVSQGVQTRSFVYDSLKRLTLASNPESGTTSYTYDNNGNILTKTDARNIVTNIAYDALNRPTSKSYQNDGGITPAVAYFYDAQSLPGGAPTFNRGYSTGRVVAMTYGGTSAGDYFGYDALGRTLRKIQQTDSVNYLVEASYNVSGALTNETYPSGRVVSYGYDSAGRPSSVTGNLGDGNQRTYSTGISYSAFGGMAQEQFGTTTPLYHKRHYNIRGQLYDLRVSTLAWATDEWNWNRGAVVLYYGGAAWGQSSTTNNGNVTMQQHWVPSNEAITDYTYTQQSYSYADPLNRLSSVSELHGGTWGQSGTDYVQAYDYDRYGNRTVHQTNTWGANIPKPNFGVDPNTNRLTAPAGYAMSYDAVGNLTNDTYTGQGARTFDAENRMTSAGIAGASPALYAYAGDGQRIKRIVNGVETWQVYGLGGELIAEYAANTAPSTPQKEYGYRNGDLLITADGRTNVALSSNGGVASASTAHTCCGFSVGGAINGNINGPWGNGEGWNDATPNELPDWFQVDFAGSKTIDEIDVFSLHDNYTEPNTPTETQTFSLYGLVNFEVQYWNGSSWATIPGGSVSGNNKVWRKFTFAPIATSKIRLWITGVPDAWSRLVELQAWEAAGGGGSANIRWLVTDQLGTPRMVFDQSGSLATVSRHDYLPFGEDVPSNFRTGIQGYATGDSVRQKFTGYEADAETGLNFAQARYQSSTQGRFTSADPFGGSMITADPQTFNRYAYVSNNPLAFIDSSGMMAERGGPSLPGANGALGRAGVGQGLFDGTDGRNGQRWTMAGGCGHNHVTTSQARAARTVEAAVMRGVAEAVTPQQQKPQVVDVRNDPNITNAVEVIKANAIPLAKSETAILSSVVTVVGQTSQLNNTSIIDAYGRQSIPYTGTLLPVGYIPLDQGGNIMPYTSGVINEEFVVTESGPEPETSGVAPLPPGRVFIDVHTALAGDPVVKGNQNVIITQGGTGFKIGPNKITKDYGARQVSVEKGPTKPYKY